MKPKYRSEKHDGKWFAMRGEEKASAPFDTKHEAEYAATDRMCADLRYEEICNHLNQ